MVTTSKKNTNTKEYYFTATENDFTAFVFTGGNCY